jgi:hypothetical protein
MRKILVGILLILGFSNTGNAGIYCKYLSSCSEACHYYNQGYYRLDRDRDGIPCENLCSSPCNTSYNKKKHQRTHKKYSTSTHISTSKNINSKTKHHNEKYYQQEFCKKVLGIMEYRLNDGTRIDCYTSTYSFEVDFAKKAYEAIGQSLHYADVIDNKPGIVLIVRRAKDKKYVNRIKHTAKKYGIKIFTIDNNLKIRVVK